MKYAKEGGDHIVISRKKINVIFGMLVFFTTLLNPLNIAYAQTDYQNCIQSGNTHAECSSLYMNSNNDFTITQPGQVITNIPNLIGFAIQLLFIIAGLVAFVYLLLGGIKWITSGGDKGQVEAARNQIIQALIGLVVVFLAWGLIVLIQNLFGLCLGFGCTFDLPDPSTLRQP